MLISEKFRAKLHTVIHEADTPAGKLFDLTLLALIIISIAALMLESVASIRLQYGHELEVTEWVITIFFTFEYIGRVISVRKPKRYITSFYGVTDFLATLPGYIDLLFPGWHFLLALRAIRLLRIFRILKLVHFVGAGNLLIIALKKSRIKIFVFIFSVVVLCVILGTIMYLVEGAKNGFTDIPTSIYWTIVTLTTVGFGDITPQTPLGQLISTVIMIVGYGIIAVPTGIVTSEIVSARKDNNTQACPDCGENTHRDDANFCFRCGGKIYE